jgi:hypothetical protein
MAVDRAQGNAPGRMVVAVSEKQTSGRRSVGTGQTFQLFIEALEVQTETERISILEEKFADLLDLFRRRCLNDLDRRVGKRCHKTSSHKRIAQPAADD